MSASSSGRLRLISSLLLILVFLGIGGGLFFYAASPAGAAIFATPTATQENLWAYANVPKLAYTATSIPPPTETTIPATETPGVMTMKIVDEADVPVAQDSSHKDVPTAGGEKYILVDISEQHMYVYENNALLYSFVASTGINNATRVGVFHVQSKIPNAYGATWNIWMPDWLGIYWAGSLENGIHALPILPNGATLWEGYLGRPVSYGCVVLSTYNAQLLYNWAEIGTTVEIQW